ncbi:MAG: glucosaminidase domain-containing protein [Eubacterium sp.]|nr:glucosaminidase domain-containing protein [Eubacterium sp.]
MKRKALVLLLAGAITFGFAPESSAAQSFTAEQQKRVDTIYDVVSKEKNWKTYGSLPSVCIAQAYVESTMGMAGSRNNLWGLGGGRYSYRTLKQGIYAYMRCINKSYYTRYGATDTKSWKKQISRILRGGYCVPAGGYYTKVARVVKQFDLQKYDKKMFNEFKKAKKLRKQRRLARLRKIREQEEREQREQMFKNLEFLYGNWFTEMSFDLF